MASLFKKKTVDDVIKEQNRELRGTQRAIIRDRAALEKQEKQLVSRTLNFSCFLSSLKLSEDFWASSFIKLNCFVPSFPHPPVNDTLDDIFEGSDDEEESQDIVNQVLDEIGIEISGKMAKAPSAARSLPSASTSKATISDEEIERQLKALGVD
ncbi:PREDICTED: charged multivesicular body protein 2b [Propithecus coquereli]|uniref:charged multivesicular body protein 2b n=1 Tax=Propithecus coquereli TaxID=379532 RepID=UPI00063EDC84|nr:PREDICTED: charged multivesicular body protein 2b [Propithecus coquereli]